MKAGTLRSVSFWPVLSSYVKGEKGYEAVHQALQQAAAMVVAQKPKVIIMMSQYQHTLSDAIGISPQARLVGHYEVSEKDKIEVGFESDIALTKLLYREGERLGIPFLNILDNVPSLRMEDYTLHESATIPLWYLQEAGLKGAQIVRLTMGSLSYEELYTAGKVVQMAVQQTKRKAAIVGATNLLPCRLVNGVDVNVDHNLQIMAALGDQKISLIQELGYTLDTGFTLRSAAFILGAISGLTMGRPLHYYEENQGQSYGIMQYIQD